MGRAGVAEAISRPFLAQDIPELFASRGPDFGLNSVNVKLIEGWLIVTQSIN